MQEQQQPRDAGFLIKALIIGALSAAAIFLYVVFRDRQWFYIPLVPLFIYFQYLSYKSKQKNAPEEEDEEEEGEEEETASEGGEEEEEAGETAIEDGKDKTVIEGGDEATGEKEEETEGETYEEETGPEPASALQYNGNADDPYEKSVLKTKILFIAAVVAVIGALIYYVPGLNVFTKGPRLSGSKNTPYNDAQNSVNAGIAKDGPFKKFNMDGSLAVEGAYKEGRLEGLYLEYYSNGMIKSKTVYAGGGIQGETVFYDLRGNAVSKEAVPNAGPITGTQGARAVTNGPELKGFILSTLIKSKRENQDGINWEKRGLEFRRFHENGKLMVFGRYKKKVTLDMYENYLPDGEWDFYSGDGAFIEKRFYEEGRLVKTVQFDGKGNITGRQDNN